MRHHSPKNSRKWENLPFRRAYMTDHPHCELTPYLKGIVPGLYPRETATDPHHLFGGNGRRHDCALNLLAVCRPVHLWAHANLKESRILGIWLKRKQGLFDDAEFYRVSGKYLAGFLEINEPTAPAFVKLWKELQ